MSDLPENQVIEGRIACIAGSAGALEALVSILPELSPMLEIPVVVLIHRSHPGASGLVPVLQAHCALPVREIDDLDEIESGIVHLAPAGYNVLIGAGVFVLTLEPPDYFSVPSISALFGSGAPVFGPGLLAIALSCANSDGAGGAGAVKTFGGTIIAQDRSTATHPTLVDAVSGLADRTLSPVEIGRAINEWAAG